MSDNIITRQCSSCNQVKLLTEFYIDRSRKNGHQHYCKVCLNFFNKQYRQTEKGKKYRKHYCQTKEYKIRKRIGARKYHQSEKGKHTIHKALRKFRHTEKGKALYERYYARPPERRKARLTVMNAIHSGKLKYARNFKCAYCPAQAEHYHHPSYAPDKRLDIIPVCAKCHKLIHNQGLGEILR
jgi:hypothetical protein